MALTTIDEIIGNDIYGFLGYLSPRQGAQDSTVQQPPPPSMPPDTLLPFQPPKPTASRPIKTAGMIIGPPDPPPPPSPPPPAPLPQVPTPGPEARPPTSHDEGLPIGTKPQPWKGAINPNVPDILPFNSNAGSIDVKSILAKQIEDSKRAQFFDRLGDAGLSLGRGFSRDPAIHALGDSGATGSRSGQVAGQLSVENLVKLDELSRGQAAANYRANTLIPYLAKRYRGLSVGALQSMDADKLSTLEIAAQKGEFDDIRTFGDGSLWAIPKGGGTPQQISGPDTFKVSEEERKRSEEERAAQLAPLTRQKTAVEIEKGAGEETRARTAETERLQRRLTIMENADEIGAQLGVNAAVVRDMKPEEVMSALQARGQDLMTIDRIRQEKRAAAAAQGDAQGPAVPSATEEYKRAENERAAKLKEIEATSGVEVKGIMEANEKDDTTLSSLRQTRATRDQARKDLMGGIVAGSALSPVALAFRKIKAGITGDQDPAVARTETYVATQAQQVAEKIKAFGSGTGLSNADREYAAEMVAGRITATPESMRRITAINDFLDRRKYAETADKIERRYAARPGMSRIVEPGELPVFETEQLRFLDNEELARLGKGDDASFDRLYGKGSAKEVMTKLPDLIASKLMTEDQDSRLYSVRHDELAQKIATMPLDQLRASRDALKQQLGDQGRGANQDSDQVSQFGSQAQGLVDTVIALRERAEKGK